MAGNRRSPFGDGAGSANTPSFDDERTFVDDGPPPDPPQGFSDDSQPAGKSAHSGGDPFETQTATMDEYTVEESARKLKRQAQQAGQAKLRERPASAVGKLNITAGSDKGRTFDLTGRRLSIGRGVDNDIVLSDLAVSRQHLTIEFEHGQYYVRDLGSGNGTLVNDIEERDRIRIRHGDTLELGNTIVVVELPHEVHEMATMDAAAAERFDHAVTPMKPGSGDELETVAGKKPERKLVGAGVAKARAQAAQLEGRPGGKQAARGSLGATPAASAGASPSAPPIARSSNLPNGVAPPSEATAIAGPGVGSMGPPPGLPPGAAARGPLPSRGLGGGLGPLSGRSFQGPAIGGEVGAPRSAAPSDRHGVVPASQALFGQPTGGSGHEQLTDAPPAAPPTGPGPQRLGPPRLHSVVPGSIPPGPGPSLLGAPPTGGEAQPMPRLPPGRPPWASDALPVAAPSGPIPTQPPQSDRLPVGPPVTSEAIPKLGAQPSFLSAPGMAPPLPAPRSQKKTLFIAFGAVIVLAIIAGVALATLGGGDERGSEGDDSSDVDTAVADKGDDKKTADKGDDKKADDKGDDKKADDKKKTDKSLVAALPVKTWGTDEVELASGLGLKSPPADEGDDKPDDETPVTDEGEDKADDETPPTDEGDDTADEPPPAKITKKPPTKRDVRKAPPKRVVRKAPPKRVVRKKPPKRVVRETPAPKSSGKSSKDRAKAAALYKSKNFGAAASLLRSSAKRASSAEKKAMLALASKYSAVGSAMKKGDSSLSNAPAAVSAYASALRADRSAGKAHQGILRTKIKLYAPKAAKTYMARNNYPGAKKMADLAASVGAGAKVSSVRSSLERKAGQLVAAAKTDAKAGRKAKAIKKLRTVKQIVPRSSSHYKAAVSGLRTLGG